MERILTEDEVLNAKWNAIITGQPIHEELDDIDAEYLTESDMEYLNENLTHLKRHLKVMAGASKYPSIEYRYNHYDVRDIMRKDRQEGIKKRKNAERNAHIYSSEFQKNQGAGAKKPLSTGDKVGIGVAAAAVGVAGLAALYAGVKHLIKKHKEAKDTKEKAHIEQQIHAKRAEIAKKKAAAHKK